MFSNSLRASECIASPAPTNIPISMIFWVNHTGTKKLSNLTVSYSGQLGEVNSGTTTLGPKTISKANTYPGKRDGPSPAKPIHRYIKKMWDFFGKVDMYTGSVIFCLASLLVASDV